MKALFSALMGVYVLYAVLVNRRDESAQPSFAKRFGVLLHAPLFAAACYLGAKNGVFSRQLVSPPYIAAGLIAGHLIFGVSLLATHQSWRDAVAQFVDLHPLWEFIADNPNVLMRFVGVSLGEELIYRVAAQPLAIACTGSRVAGILAVAALFSVVHRHFLRNPMGQSAEFVAFAILLGVLYHLTGSLILVIVVHAVRNIEIAYLEQLIKAGETEHGASVNNSDSRPCSCGAPERT